MKKFIKFIAIACVIVLSLTAFAGCDTSTSNKSKGISVFEFMENKTKLVKKYDFDDYDHIQDFSVYNKITNELRYEEEIENTSDIQTELETEVVKLYSIDCYDSSLQVKRIDDDVFLTITFIQETSNNRFNFVEGNLVEYKDSYNQIDIYQTGKNEYGYYMIKQTECSRLSAGYNDFSESSDYFYFSDREAYKNYVCYYLESDFEVDDVYYNDSYYLLTKTGEEVDLNAIASTWGMDGNEFFVRKNTFNAKYTLDGIYTQSKFFDEVKGGLAYVHNSEVVSFIEYSAKYDRIELNFNNSIEFYFTLPTNDIIKYGHAF